MRTTLDIADDVLLAAKEQARKERKSVGEVLSELARRTLTRAEPAEAPAPARPERELLGFRPFPSRGGIVTDELVDQLRNEDGC